MCKALATTLSEFRQQTPYDKDEDFVFASPILNGKQPVVGADHERTVRQASRSRVGLVMDEDHFGSAPLPSQPKYVGERCDQGHHGQPDHAPPCHTSYHGGDL